MDKSTGGENRPALLLTVSRRLKSSLSKLIYYPNYLYNTLSHKDKADNSLDNF